MSIAAPDLKAAAKSIAQDNGADDAIGLKLLLATGDYDSAIDQALGLFSQDRPNRRVYDYTVTVAGFRFPLSGASAILPTSGADAWVEGASFLAAVWWPYDDTDQAAEPLDPNTWRTRGLPDGITGLELIEGQAAVGQVLRLEYTGPHTVHATDAAQSSIRPGDVKALKLLTASFVLTLAANKFMQNTGNTGLPGDVVDRRTQADVARSLAKDLLQRYQTLVGKATSATEIGAASGFKELDVEPVTGRGALWHPSRLR